MASAPTIDIPADAATEEVTLALPVDLLRRAEEVAAQQGWSRERVVRQALFYYLSTLRWQEIHKVFAPQAEALGLRTEDDVEDCLDSLADDRA